MVKIEWSLYSDQPLDVDSLLGEFFLVMDRVSVGSRDTYVEGWFALMTSLVVALRSGQEFIQEMEEEPIRVRASQWDGKTTLSFNDVTVRDISAADLEAEVQRSSSQFLSEVEKGDRRRTEELSAIRHFVEIGPLVQTAPKMHS